MVTIPTVKISSSFACLAIIGAAPVPVPPPIPAVIKIILVLVSNICLISSKLSTAAFSPISGFAPAPSPSVKVTPNWILFGTELFSKAWESVLQTTKSTPFIPAWNIWLMALLPPPPTPITLMTFDWFFGKSNEMSPNSVLLINSVLLVVLYLFYSALSKKSLNFSAHLSKMLFRATLLEEGSSL